jgi:hypothetical protein
LINFNDPSEGISLRIDHREPSNTINAAGTEAGSSTLTGSGDNPYPGGENPGSRRTECRSIAKPAETSPGPDMMPDGSSDSEAGHRVAIFIARSAPPTGHRTPGAVSLPRGLANHFSSCRRYPPFIPHRAGHTNFSTEARHRQYSIAADAGEEA